MPNPRYGWHLDCANEKQQLEHTYFRKHRSLTTNKRKFPTNDIDYATGAMQMLCARAPCYILSIAKT